MWLFLIILTIIVGIITVVYKIENEKYKRVILFQKMSPTKINALGNYEDKATKKYPINLSWKEKNKD